MKAYLQIIRPYNCLFIALTVWFGAIFRQSMFMNAPLVAAMLSAVIIGAGGYIINDYFDLSIDIINKPARPLAAGKIKPRTAYLLACFLFLMGIFASLFTRNIICVGLSFFNTFCLFFYAKKYKKSYLIGNLSIAWLAGCTFIFGALAATGNWCIALPPAVFSFLYTLVREIIKDAEDIEGDTSMQARTFAIVHSVCASTVFAALVSAALVMSTIYYYLPQMRLAALVFILILTLPLVYFHYTLIKYPLKRYFSLVSHLIKIHMLIMLALLYFI